MNRALACIAVGQKGVCLRTTIYVSAYCYIGPHTTACVRTLLYECPHTTIARVGRLRLDTSVNHNVNVVRPGQQTQYREHSSKVHFTATLLSTGFAAALLTLLLRLTHDERCCDAGRLPILLYISPQREVTQKIRREVTQKIK
jgi:hypothetical protein